jgi:membrane-associated phospholipid phosphatase
MTRYIKSWITPQDALSRAASGEHAVTLQRIVLALQIGAAAVLSLLLADQGVLPVLAGIGLIAVSIFLWRAGERYTLLNFLPLLMLLATYELLRGVALQMDLSRLHVLDLIAWEKAVAGGTIAAHAIQEAIGDGSQLRLLDLVANTFYMTHFVAAVVLAAVLWRYRRGWYWPFLLGLVILSYAAFSTYLLFPAAPPWWATAKGYLTDQPVNLAHSLLTAEYILANAIPLAAMPSLHTAYPFYMALFCIRVWGWRGAPVLILPIGVALASLYLGHHYLVDILAGMAYAAVFLAVMLGLCGIIQNRRSDSTET